MIDRFTPSGNKSVFASGLSSTTGVAYGMDGNLYVGDNDDGQLYEISRSGDRRVVSSPVRNPTGVAYMTSSPIVTGGPTHGVASSSHAPWPDDFGHDQELRPDLWSTGTPLLAMLARKASDVSARCIEPQISFSGDGLTMVSSPI
jgi:hypothetical protein